MQALAVPAQTEPHMLAPETAAAAAVELATRLEEIENPAMPAVIVPRSAVAAENRFDPLIARSSARWGVPAWLVKSVIATESGFRPNAVREEPLVRRADGSRGDRSRGLMQLLEDTAERLGYSGPFERLFDPGVNIHLGTALLADLLGRYKGDVDRALAAYNGGSARLDEHGKLVAVLAGYVQRVRGHAKRFTLGQKLGAAGGVGLGLLLLAAFFVLRRR